MISYQAMCFKFQEKFPEPNSHSINANLSKAGSVQFSHSVVADSQRPHGLQHARPPCPSPTPGT